MGNISELPQLLSKQASTTAGPVPADLAGKGKEIAPEKKIQPDVKLPFGSKRPSGIDDIESDEDDVLPMDNISDLRQLLGKTSITADPAGKVKEIAPEKDQPDVKLPSGSKLPSGMDELDVDPIPAPDDLAGKDPSDVKISSSSNNPTKTGDMEDKDTAKDVDDLDEDSDEDYDFGSRGYRFEPSPGGGFRLECPTPSGGYFDSMSLEGPNEDGLYVFSLTNTRI